MLGKQYKNVFKLTIILFALLLLCCKEASDYVPKDKAAEVQDSVDTQVVSLDKAYTSDDIPKDKSVETKDSVNANIESCKTATIKDFICFLGKSIDSLPDIKGYEKGKKEIEQEYEDLEGVLDTSSAWLSVKYKNKNKLTIVFQADFKNKDIFRVTLYSDEFKEGDVYVGQAFGNVRKLVMEKFNETRIYLVFAILKEHPGIHIGLNISNLPSTDPFYLNHGEIASLSEIPDSSKIQSIVVMKPWD